MIKRIVLLLSISVLWFLPVFPHVTSAQGDSTEVLLLTGEGPITPSMLGYLERGLTTAEQQGSEALIFMLDTPGGSIDLMNEFVQVIRNSSIPVVVYVAPQGAIAGSAGTVITLAGHASAMAPETAIGAASPVGAEGQDLGETIEAKEKNILKALVRTLAEERGEEAIQVAEETIESAQAVTASEAYQIGLVDFIANNVANLLDQLDGFTVTTIDGEVILDTANALVIPIDPSFIEALLGVLTNPNIVFLLLTVGVQAILIELSSPGGWIAGFIGAVCLALAAYGLGVLPVNWFGLIFLAIAFVLFVLDIKAPTHGALTAAGVASLIVGSLVLFNSPGTPSFLRVSVPLVIGVSLATAGIFFAILTIALRAQRAPVSMGRESLLGRTGSARSAISPVGTVQLGGELWTSELAEGEDPIAEGSPVEVIEVKGVRIVVRQIRPLEESQP
ncbi:MAG: nodulation protein NfeD [Chloroflexota bacterium]|nr:MAG: nodulation protein NfeD [Chloroflexota bacterium]